MNSSTLHGWRTLDKADFLKELSRLGEDIRFQDHPDVSPLQLSSSDLVLTNEVMSIPAYQVEREVRVEHGRNTFPEKPRRKDEAFYCCQLLSYDDTTLDFAEVYHMTANDLNQDSQRE